VAEHKEDLLPELMEELKREERTPDFLMEHERPKGAQKKKLVRIVIIGALVGLFFLVVKIDRPVKGVAHVVPSQLLRIEALETGVIDEVLVKSGQQVTKGTLIAKMSNSDLSGELKELRLQRDITRKKLLQLDRRKNYLRLMLNNHKELYHDEIIARSELEKVRLEYTHAQQEYDIYQDELENLRSKLNSVQHALYQMEVDAPITGIILTKIENKLGTFARKGDELCQIANMDGFLLELPINERVIDNVSVGQEATVRFSAFPQLPIHAEVVEIQHTAWEKLKKVLVKENVLNVYIRLTDEQLPPVKPGMTAYVKIHSGNMAFVWSNRSLPATAIASLD